MEQSPSWEANSHAASKEFSLLSWTHNLHYRVRNSPPLVHILSQICSVDIFHPISLRSIQTLSSHLPLDLPSGLFPSDLPTKISYEFLISHTFYISCPSHTTWLITLITFVEAYKLWSSSLCRFLQPPATSYLLDPNILPSTLFSYTLNLSSYLSARERDTKFHTHTTQRIQLLFCIF
jgi:hypothetical protein